MQGMAGTGGLIKTIIVKLTRMPQGAKDSLL
jgi:hypothetical protein